MGAEDPTDEEESGDDAGAGDSPPPVPARVRLVYGEYSSDLTAGDASVTVRAVDVLDETITSIDLVTTSATGHGPYQLLHMSTAGDALVVESTDVSTIVDSPPGTWVFALDDEPFAATELAQIPGHNQITYSGQAPLKVERIDDVFIARSGPVATATSVSTGDVVTFGEDVRTLTAIPDAGAALLTTEDEIRLARFGSQVEVTPVGSGDPGSVSAAADRVAFSVSGPEHWEVHVSAPGQPDVLNLVAEGNSPNSAGVQIAPDGAGLIVDPYAFSGGVSIPAAYHDLSTGETVELQASRGDATFTDDGDYLLYETRDDETAVLDRDSMSQVVYELRSLGLCADGFFARVGDAGEGRVVWQPLAGGDPVELAPAPSFGGITCAPSND
ncbi:MAG: hypothetical protein AAF721_08755, partial [Myxococcota bacterium]